MNCVKSLMAVALLCGWLTGCALDVSPKSFIYQDSAKQPLDTTALHQATTRNEDEVAITTVTLTNAQGLSLTGVAVSYPRPIVNIVFYGGNGMTINKGSALLTHFGKIPANILWLDYQGMGSSDKAAKLRVANLQADALQVFDYAKEVFPDNLPVIVHGLSMGSLLATYVAEQRPVDGLVLDGAIGSVPDLVDNMVPAWSKLFTNVKIHPDLLNIDNTRMLQEYVGPLMLLVGEKDKTTPVSISEHLYTLSPSTNKELVIVPDATHGNSMKKPVVVDQYRRFVASL